MAQRAGSAGGPKYPYFLTRVRSTARITPRLHRITVGAPELAEFPRRSADQWVKLFFPLTGQHEPQVPELRDDDVSDWYRRYLAMPDELRPPMRTYTVRAHRSDPAELDIEFVLHGDIGPASRWASRAQPGDYLGVLAGASAFDPPERPPWLLLAGDHTALPAITTILESVTPATPARVFVELDDPADRRPLPDLPGVRVHWVNRPASGSVAAPGDALVDALWQAEFPAGTPYAWVAGEAGLVRTLRRHLVNDRQVPRRAITFMGYWRRGKAESDAYTEEELAEASA